MSERNLDFDAIIDRRNTKCLKYDFAARRGYPEDILPLWVADMDFKSSSYAEDAIRKVADHGIYGYTNIQKGDGFFEALSGWMKRRHNWDIDARWHVMTPGVVFGIAVAIRALTKSQDAILIQQPVYYPFENIIKQNGRRMVSSDLVRGSNGKWEMDLDDFEQKIIKNDIKLFILCNPHNPVGRVWTKEELLAVGKICQKHDVIVFSDEIHFDFIWQGEHHVFQELDPSFRDMTITATSPSKTFNLAGLQHSNLFIPNHVILRKFKEELNATGYDEPPLFGIAAAQAVYSDGDTWYDAMMKYVGNNIDTACKYINDNIPGVTIRKPEGTYLLWLDLTGTGLDDDTINDMIVNKAKLWLDAGKIFGKCGSRFQRINAACPESVLFEALNRLKNTFSG